MGVRQDFERRIAKKNQEIADLELRLRDARSYVQALRDAMKIVPKDMLEQTASGRGLRPGSALFRARRVIKKAGKPLHIMEILKAMGKPQDKSNRVSVSGSLAAYVRKKEIFTRPEPNTYGLYEFESGGTELPDSFGDV